MKVAILGCGTSSGVPRIGGDWGACDPTDPRNRRSRASILVEAGGTRVLVDSGPDMREQLLRADVGAIDAVIWTHDHADHTHGIDDLRQLFHIRGAPVICHARPASLAILRRRFDYAFDGKDGYPPTVEGRVLPDRVEIGALAISVVDQPHGSISSAGLRFEAAGFRIGYSTDFNVMTADMLGLFEDLDLWIVDCLRRTPHPTHPHLKEVLDWIAQLRPRRVLLTHMDQSLDFAALAAELPPDVAPAYDGQIVTLP